MQETEQSSHLEEILEPLLAEPCPSVDGFTQIPSQPKGQTQKVSESWALQLPNGAELFDHYTNRRYHEWFCEIEKLIRGESGSLTEKMELMVKALQPDMDYYNSRRLLNLAVDISMKSEDGLAGLKFLKVWEKLSTVSPEDNKILYKSTITWQVLRMNKIESCETLMDELKPLVEHGFGLKPETEAVYYRVLTQLHYARRDFSKVYRYGMYYLKNSTRGERYKTNAASAEIPLTPEERVLAELLCEASLMAPDVYSFTQLLHEPAIVQLGRDGNSKWHDLVVICNSGDISMYELYAESNDLSGVDEKLLQDKLRSFALLETAFKKSADDRVLTFQEVAQVCRIPMTQVEPTILKLMKRGLMKGSIDAIDMIINFNYLQPRILDETKILAMAQQFAHWTEQMKSAHQLISAMSPALFSVTQKF